MLPSHVRLNILCFDFAMQHSTDIGEDAKGVNINYPYIGVLKNDSVLSFAVIAERLVLLATKSFFKALKGLMAAFYVFNIEYPKFIRLPLLFIQHFFFSIVEKSLPPACVRLISSLDNL